MDFIQEHLWPIAGIWAILFILILYYYGSSSTAAATRSAPSSAPSTSGVSPSPSASASATSCLGATGSYTYPYGAQLVRGNTLNACSGLQSSDNSHVAVQQSDGNFVIYNAATGKPTWSTNTYMKGVQPNNFTYQTDGNLVVYDSAGKAYWSPNTFGKPSTALTMQTDGNLVLYNGAAPVWSSKTSGK